MLYYILINKKGEFNMLRVFVALGKQLPKNKAMIEDTEDVGKLLAKYNCTLVQGGARIGLMGVVLEEFQKYSDEVVLIVPEAHKSDLEGTSSKEHYIVEGEADRLKITINTCDLIVVLPGGTGTMAELNYYNETCKSGEHHAKIVMINTKGFYNKLFKFINHQTKCGFMKKEDFKFEVIQNAKQLEPIIKELITEKQSKIQQEQIENDKESLVEEAKEVAQIETIKPVKKVVKASAKSKTSKTTKTVDKPKTTAKSVKDSAKDVKATKVSTKSTTKPSVSTKKTSKEKANEAKVDEEKVTVPKVKVKKEVEAKASKPKAKVSATKTQTKSTPKAKTPSATKSKTAVEKSATKTDVSKSAKNTKTETKAKTATKAKSTATKKAVK